MIDPAFVLYHQGLDRLHAGAHRLLDFELGCEPTGQPVTARTMFARLALDPLASAMRLMGLPPEIALAELVRTLNGFQIAGEPCCPDPDATARAALSHAGRVLPGTDDPLLEPGPWLYRRIVRLLARLSGPHKAG